MDSLKQFLSSRTRTKISLATLICLFAFGFLYEAWRRDTVHAVMDYGAKYTEQIQHGQPDTEGFKQDKDEIEGVVFATTTIYPTTTVSTTDTTTVPTTPEPTQSRPAIIAGSVDPETLSWMQELSSSYDIHPYSVQSHDPTSPNSVPANKGREAMVYLTYLITHYAQLPPHAIFIHGHINAWHQDKPITTLISSLQIPALQETGYISLRCSWSPSCPAELRPVAHDAVVWGDGTNVRETEDAIGKAWVSLFPGIQVPETVASQCCAQFAVTREAMLRWGREDYVRMRDWILETELDDAVSGRVFEKLWAYIFTGEAVHCPAPQTCSCKYFNDCGPHHWPIPPAELGPLPDER